jgi:hypothetical protein
MARPLLLWMFCIGCQAGGGAVLVGHAVLDGESDHSGIEVTLAGPTSVVTRTAADGSYRFGEVSAGSYLVSARAEATREGTLLAEADGTQRAIPDFIFHPVGALSGRVTRAGSPAGNGGIIVLAPGSSGVAISDDGGAFHIEQLAPGSYDLFAFTSGFLSGSSRGVEVRRGETTTVPELDLVAAASGGPQPGQLHGLVRPVGDEDPSGVTVQVVGGGSALSQSDGSFLLPNPPDGIYSLSFSRDLYSEVVPSVLALPDASGFYVDGSLYPLDGSTLVLPRGVRQMGGAIYTASLSPNGDYVLFLRVDDTPGYLRSLYSVPAGGGTPVLIAGRIAAGNFWLSPDGTRVLYGTGGSGPKADLWTAPVGGGPPLSIATGVRFIYGYTPNGGHILYSHDGYNDLYAAPSAGGSELLVADDVNGYQVSPTTGELIAMLNCHDSQLCDVVRVPLSGAARTVLATQQYWFLASPALDRVLYSDGHTLVFADAVSGDVTLSTAFTAYAPQFTSDGQQVVFESTGDAGAIDVNVVAAAGGTPVKLLSTLPYRPFNLSPGGKVVYLENPQAALSIDGGPEKPFARGRLQRSPKKSWMSLLSDYQQASQTVTLSVAPAETGDFRVVATDVLEDSIAFSADDSQIAYLVDDGHIGVSGWLEVAPAAGGAATRLAGGARPPVTFSPGGTRLLYGVGDPVGNPTLWTVPVAGGAAHGLGEHSRAALFADEQTVFSISDQVARPFSFQRGLYRLRAE